MHPTEHSIGKINSGILRLTIPAILSNITVPLLGLSDTYISGHLGAELYISAIAVGTTMINSLYWLFGFLRTGTTGLTAEAYGAANHSEMRRVFTAAFMLAVLLGVCMILCRPLLSEAMLFFISPSEATRILGEKYFAISLLAAPAFLATMTITGWMIGMQNTFYPMIMALSVNVINIALSFTLVFGFNTGFIGVAIGTAVANWCGLLIGLYLARRLSNGRKLWCRISDLKGNFDFRRFFQVNSDLMLRSACIMGVLFAMTSFGGRISDHALAVNAIIMQFFMFFSYFMDGFAFSAEALCGRFAGAGDKSGIYLTVKVLGVWTIIITSLFTVIYATSATPITAWLTDEESVVFSIATMHRILILIPIISAAAFIFDGIYIGMTATRRLLISTAIAMTGFFLVAKMNDISAVIFSLIHGMNNPDGATNIIYVCSPNNLLWYGFLIFLLLRGLLLAIQMPKIVRKVSSGL